MGNATVICSDKTGTLTQNKMSVVSGCFGSSEPFGKFPLNTTGLSISISDTLKKFPLSFEKLLLHSLALNTTAFEEQQSEDKKFIGNKTEVALLQFAHQGLGLNLSDVRTSNHIEHVYPFDSARKAMAVVYARPTGSGYRFLVKGAPEILLTASSHMVCPGPEEENSAACVISPDDRRLISGMIDAYSRASLRAIGLAYRDFPAWPSALQDRQPTFDDFFHDITWIGAFGIHDPLRPEVSGAIQTCRAAGIQVKMVTGSFADFYMVCMCTH